MISLPTKPLIFLDIDGVLNNHISHKVLHYNTIDKDLASIFNDLLWKSNAEFVLSSSWRYMALCESMKLDGLRNLFLSHWVDGNRLIGVTRKDISNKRTDRGPQITEWLANHGKQRKYVVIDDIDLEISECGHPLVLTNREVGLTHLKAQECLRILCCH